jgi:hypothetical protein
LREQAEGRDAAVKNRRYVLAPRQNLPLVTERLIIPRTPVR